MWKTDHFSYSASHAPGHVPVAGMVRYGVDVRSLDDSGRVSDPVTFLVLIEDQGETAWNEAHAIIKARELAGEIARDGALRVEGSTAAAL
ncbi:MAG: hypothetical protein ACRYGP_30295 [Janthinobacterium lividum]